MKSFLKIICSHRIERKNAMQKGVIRREEARGVHGWLAKKIKENYSSCFISPCLERSGKGKGILFFHEK
jgi:hypothetical protein